MKPSAVAYERPSSVDEAVGLLQRFGDDAKLLAGGQSLIAALNMRLSAPTVLVDINRIPGLDAIERNGETIRIGALARHSAVEVSAAVAEALPLVRAAMPHVAHRAIRNRGTFGGSIAFADPAAELPACLVALGGTVEATGPGGARRIAADDFFRDLYETALAQDEVLTAVELPAATADRRFAFDELSRRHGDYAMVGLAAAASRRDGRFEDSRLVYFGVGLTPVRARAAEAALDGRTVDDCDAAAAAAAEALGSDLDPPDDVQASGAMKRVLARTLTARLVRRLADKKEEAR